jgi:hypothetical protein
MRFFRFAMHCEIVPVVLWVFYGWIAAAQDYWGRRRN